MNDHGAFIVHEHVNYRLYPEDSYLPESLIRRYGLKRGHQVEVTPPWSLGRISAVARDRGFLYAGANPRGMQGYAVGR